MSIVRKIEIDGSFLYDGSGDSGIENFGENKCHFQNDPDA